MSFVLEEVRNGKDIILYKNYKYRETYSVKSGDIVWKCLGKNCRASIRSNNEKTVLYSSSDTHTGQHPVTMRTMTPPTSQRGRRITPSLPSTPKPEIDLSSSPEPSSKPEQSTETLNTPLVPGYEEQNTDCISDLASTETRAYGPISSSLPVTPDPPTFPCLQKENEFLRLKVAEQRYTIQAVTTKTIELEMQLLQNDSPKNENLLIKALSPLSKPDDISAENCTSIQPTPLPQIGLSASDADELINSLRTTIQVLEAEIEYLKNDNNLVTSLKSENEKLTKLVEHQSETIHQLRKHTDHSSAFINPKSFVKPKPQLEKFLETSNRFSILDSVDLSCEESIQRNQIQTTAQVHRSASLSPRTEAKSNSSGRQRRERKNKKKIIVLSDSQGKNIYPYIQNLANEYEVFVHSKPGAKLKHIVNAAKCSIEKCTENDFVVLLAGTNDIGQYEPSQLSIAQGLKSLLSIEVETNVIINSVPYRYDTMQFNDKIFYANKAITKLIREYKGKLSVSYGELNAILQRRHFTRHGLHINKRGKRILGRSIVDTINSRARPTIPGTGGKHTPRVEPDAPLLVSTNPHQPRETECNFSLIEACPSAEMSSADTEFITVTPSANDFRSDFRITTFKDFPPLTLSPRVENAFNSSTNIDTVNNTSKVFLEEI